MREGILFIVSGPSGSGKTTLAKRVIERLDNLRFSVSYTTRQPRPGEVDGVDYKFISNSEFDDMVRNNCFAEWAVVHGKRYGTPVTEFVKTKSLGIDLVLDIDVQGARSIRTRYGQGVYVFVVPPSMRVLEERLRERSTENADQVAIRLGCVKAEMEEVRFYDYIIINDQLDMALEDLKSLIRAERCKRDINLERVKLTFWK